MKRKGILRLLVLTTVLSSLIIGCAKEDDPSLALGTPDRNKFFGTWHVSSNGSLSGNQFWDMVISASNSSEDQILIKDFDLQNGTTTIAFVSGNNFTITSQVISGETVKGSGNYSNGNLIFQYTAVDSQTDSVSATAHK